MSVALSSDVLQDDVAVTAARVIASANRRARELNVDVMQSIISLTQHSQNGSWIWRVIQRTQVFRESFGGSS
jgi:hypothetical protein